MANELPTLEEKVSIYIQDHHQEVLDILNGVHFWERFWPENVLEKDFKDKEVFFLEPHNVIYDSLKGQSIDLNNDNIFNVLDKINKKEEVSYKDVCSLHYAMSNFEHTLNKKVQTFNLSKDKWLDFFDKHIEEELIAIEGGKKSDLMALKVLSIYHPQKMVDLSKKFNKVFVHKEKVVEKKVVKNETYVSTKNILENILNEFKEKSKTLNEIDLNQFSERYLKNLDDMLLRLNEGTNNPHIKSTQALFSVILNENDLFLPFVDMAKRSSIYAGQSPTIFADNRKPPVISAIIAATKAVFEKYNSQDDLEFNLDKWSAITGFNNLLEDGKAVVLRSLVEDFTDLNYKKTINFYKKMGGNPYVPITSHFDRSVDSFKKKGSPFGASSPKNEVQLSHWIFDKINDKTQKDEKSENKPDKKSYKMVK